MAEARKPQSGDLLHITSAASVQFIKPITFRVIRVLDLPTYDRWLWIEGYQLDAQGDAVARRELFVIAAGLQWLHQSAPKRRPAPVAAPTVRRPRPSAGAAQQLPSADQRAGAG